MSVRMDPGRIQPGRCMSMEGSRIQGNALRDLRRSEELSDSPGSGKLRKRAPV